MSSKNLVRAREGRAIEDETVGRHHRLNGRESEQAPGDSEGQGSLAYCSRQESGTSERLNSHHHQLFTAQCGSPKHKRRVVINWPWEARAALTTRAEAPNFGSGEQWSLQRRASLKGSSWEAKIVGRERAETLGHGDAHTGVKERTRVVTTQGLLGGGLAKG